jgi:hypothetical protein
LRETRPSLRHYCASNCSSLLSSLRGGRPSDIKRRICVHSIDVSDGVLGIDDQNKATVDEISLYRAAGAMISFGSISERDEIEAFEVTRYKAALVDVLVALCMAF